MLSDLELRMLRLRALQEQMQAAAMAQYPKLAPLQDQIFDLAERLPAVIEAPSGLDLELLKVLSIFGLNAYLQMHGDDLQAEYMKLKEE